MPLKQTSSKAGFVHNLRKELKSGKDPAQAKAIAYSVQREAKKKGK